MRRKGLPIFLLICLVLTTSASATSGFSNVLSVPAQYTYSTRSVDTTFDIDFAESTAWVLDFDNEAGLFHWNHKMVDVFYDSANKTPPKVTVKLQQKNGDTYTDVSGSEYKVSLSSGNTATFTLPNGGLLTSYRLVFSCSSTAICTFSVKSYNT